MNLFAHIVNEWIIPFNSRDKGAKNSHFPTTKSSKNPTKYINKTTKKYNEHITKVIDKENHKTCLASESSLDIMMACAYCVDVNTPAKVVIVKYKPNKP